MDAEIERLRGIMQSMAGDIIAANAAKAAAVDEVTARLTAEIDRRGQEEGRLRRLLRECDAALGWQGHNGSCLDQSFNDYDPDCPECRFLMRVREALGDAAD